MRSFLSDNFDNCWFGRFRADNQFQQGYLLYFHLFWSCLRKKKMIEIHCFFSFGPGVLISTFSSLIRLVSCLVPTLQQCSMNQPGAKHVRTG